MAMKYSNAARDAQGDALAAMFDNGYCRIYSGTQPATPDTALSGNTLLAELRFANPAYSSSTNGVITLSALTDDSAADATGTATFARCLKSDGSTVICDLTVGTSGADINLNTVSIVANAAVGISGGTITIPVS